MLIGRRYFDDEYFSQFLSLSQHQKALNLLLTTSDNSFAPKLTFISNAKTAVEVLLIEER